MRVALWWLNIKHRQLLYEILITKPASQQPKRHWMIHIKHVPCAFHICAPLPRLLIYLSYVYRVARSILFLSRLQTLHEQAAAFNPRHYNQSQKAHR